MFRDTDLLFIPTQVTILILRIKIALRNFKIRIKNLFELRPIWREI